MNDNQENEKIEAGAKTAHSALKTGATVAGNAVGGKIGAKVAGKVYDKVSNTKIGQGIENTAGKIIGKSPVGDANKKINDRVSDDNPSVKNAKPLGRGAFRRPTGNMRTQNKPNPLKQQNPKEETEKPQALQNKNHFQRLWNQVSQRRTNKETHEEKEDLEENNEENNVSGTREKKSLLKSKGMGIFSLKTKIILTLVVIVLALILIFTLIAAIISPFSSLVSIFSLDSWFREDKQYVYEDGEKKKANEDYNNAIRGSADGSVKGIVQEYQEKYDVTIDWVMLDTVIQYRYMLSDHEDLYSGDGSEDISDEELEERLEELDESEDGNINSSSSVDYVAAKKQIKTVAALMIEKSGDGYISDIEVGGGFYNRLIDSKFLKGYYKDFLLDDEYETRKKLVDEIFEQYKFAKEAIAPNGLYGIISDSMQMYLQTCKTSYDTTINERGKKVFTNNRNINAGTNYPEYFSLTDYLKGAVEGELGRSSLTDANREGVKAFVIATLSYMLGSFNVDFYPGVQSINFPTGNCRLVSCDINNGCTYTKQGMTFGTAYSGLNRFGVTTGIHKPWNDSQKAYMDNVLAEIFGIVMVKKGVTPETLASSDDFTGGNYYTDMSYCEGKANCMGQREALADSRNGMTYEEILRKYYSNFDLINIREGLYVEDAAYGNASYDGNVIFYDQSNYKSSFCGRDTSIAAAGCGVTSTAIIISTFTGNKEYDPVYFSNMARSTGDCGEDISGTNTSFFKKAAQKFNFGYERITKQNAARVIELLKQGNAMVIAHMGSGHFTNGGHYIVLSGVNDKGQVYVHDPNNKNNKAGKGTGNGWYDFNSIIVKESKSGFYAIIKR